MLLMQRQAVNLSCRPKCMKSSLLKRSTMVIALFELNGVVIDGSTCCPCFGGFAFYVGSHSNSFKTNVRCRSYCGGLDPALLLFSHIHTYSAMTCESRIYSAFTPRYSVRAPKIEPVISKTVTFFLSKWMDWLQNPPAN